MLASSLRLVVISLDRPASDVALKPPWRINVLFELHAQCLTSNTKNNPATQNCPAAPYTHFAKASHGSWVHGFTPIRGPSSLVSSVQHLGRQGKRWLCKTQVRTHHILRTQCHGHEPAITLMSARCQLRHHYAYFQCRSDKGLSTRRFWLLKTRAHHAQPHYGIHAEG